MIWFFHKQKPTCTFKIICIFCVHQHLEQHYCILEVFRQKQVIAILLFNKRPLVAYTRAAVINSVQQANLEIAEQITKGKLIHNHIIHHVFWKDAVHVILLWNPYSFQSFHSPPFSPSRKISRKEPNKFSKSSIKYPSLVNPICYPK